MFLISNHKEIKKESLSSIKYLAHHDLGEFTVWYDPSLAFIKETETSTTFVYGLCHTWQHGQSVLFTGSIKSEFLFGDYFFMSFQKYENSYTFYTDHFGLGSATYCHKESLTLFNHPELCKFIPQDFQVDFKGVKFFLEEGVFPSGSTLFNELKMTDPSLIYRFQGDLLTEVRKSTIQFPELANAEDWADQFFQILTLSTAMLTERFHISTLLLSGGTDSRLVLGSLPESQRSAITAVSQLTWNPNSNHEVDIARDLAKEWGLDFRIEQKNTELMEHGLVRFMNIQGFSEFCLSGFHGTEFIGDGKFDFLNSSLTSFSDLQRRSFHALGSSFLSSIYEDGPGVLFHLPRILMSTGIITPFRNSLLLELIQQIPADLIKDYRLYNLIFKRHLPQLAQFPFHSKFNQFSSFPSSQVQPLSFRDDQIPNLPQPVGEDWKQLAEHANNPIQEKRLAKVFYVSQLMSSNLSQTKENCAAFTKATCLTPFKKTPCCRIDSFDSKSVTMACRQCDEEESSGRTSLRRRIELATQQCSEGLVYVDVSFSNLCNLRCRMCSSQFSTSWADVDLKLNRSSHPVAEISSSEIRWIAREAKNYKIAGGEPFLYHRHNEFLRALSQREDCHEINLIYITNGTMLPDKEVVDLWGQFSQVIMTLSIDGAEVMNSYIRSKSNRYSLKDNISRFKVISNVARLRTHSVVMAYNLHKLGDLFNQLDEFGIQDNFFTVLKTPDYLSVDIIPLDEREKTLRNQLSSIPARLGTEYSNLCRQILARPYRPRLLQEFFRITEIYDHLDGFELQKINPELWSCLVSHKSVCTG
jgi:MoaA/NifB/PqqE/SkfB family radical SAM enzyme